MRLLTGSFLALIAVAMAQPTKESNEQALRAVSDSASLFSNDFTKTVAQENNGNLITSPLSANLVLAMAAYGSAGETQKQFQNVLRLPAPEEKAQIGFQALIDGLNNVEGVELSVANKIFVNKDFSVKPTFAALTSQYFRSTSESVNFNVPKDAAEVINNWVKQETRNRIDGIVDADSLDPSTALVLTNAVYFKGLWKYSFDPEDTKKRPFHINGESATKDVPTMYKKINTRYAESAELGAKILELPYKGDRMSMVIILPNEINGLAEVERKLQNVNLGKLLDEHTYSRDVYVFLPKFKIESTLDLMSTLQKMGMTDMFSRAANFSGIADAPLFVSKVMQKAFIEVNEEGSEASAVTAIEFAFLSLAEPPKPPQMRVDRPFHYSIRDTSSQVVLFEGNVYLPASE